MTAELATPDSLDSLDKSGEETEEEDKEGEVRGQEEPEREEKKSLLSNEEEKHKSSPTIQLAGGVVGSEGAGGIGGGGGGVSGGGGEMSPGSSHLIKVEREPESARCGPACGPSPLRVSVLCIVIISFWILIICIMHLDKKVGDLETL